MLSFFNVLRQLSSVCGDHDSSTLQPHSGNTFFLLFYYKKECENFNLNAPLKGEVSFMASFVVRLRTVFFLAASIILGGAAYAQNTDGSEGLPWKRQANSDSYASSTPSGQPDRGYSNAAPSYQPSPYSASPQPSQPPAYASPQNHQQNNYAASSEFDDSRYYSESEVIEAGHAFFGELSKGLAKAIESVFRRQGRPTGYILGEDAGGAFVAGVRYGEGYLHTKNGERRKIFWQGPSVGYDFGGEGSRTMVLVYDLHHPRQLYRRFAGVQGSAYVVGGASVQVLKSGNIVLAPIRTGVGLRLGANIGYLKYTPRPTWNPF